MIPRIGAHQALLSMDSPGKNTRVGCHSLLHGIFTTQGRRALYRCAMREAWTTLLERQGKEARAGGGSWQRSWGWRGKVPEAHTGLGSARDAFSPGRWGNPRAPWSRGPRAPPDGLRLQPVSPRGLPGGRAPRGRGRGRLHLSQVWFFTRLIY